MLNIFVFEPSVIIPFVCTIYLQLFLSIVFFFNLKRNGLKILIASDLVVRCSW